jgi:transcriptional regulator with XRE-family HTH domain
MSSPSPISGYIHQDGFPARLRHAAERYGGTSALARAIGRSEGAVRKWIRGVSEPNVSDLCAICRVSGTNVAWLAAGEPLEPAERDQVRERLVPYGAERNSSVNDALLEATLETLEEEVRARGANLTAAKLSAAAVALYGLARSAGRIDRNAAARLIKLAL